MPLHPSVVFAPLFLGVALAVLDVVRWRSRGPSLDLPCIVLNVLLLGACIAASGTGQAEGGRVPTTPDMLDLMGLHGRAGTTATFLSGAMLLLRAGTWKRRDAWRPALALLACGLAVLLLATGRLGGRLVFEHGAGVRQPPWDVRPGSPAPPAR